MNAYIPFGALLSSLGAASCVKQAHYLILAVRSSKWPLVHGRIVAVETRPLNLNPWRRGVEPWGGQPVTVVKYWYQIQGQKLESNTVGFRGILLGEIDESNRLRATYPPGRPVRVAVDPERPDRAVLEPGPGISGLVRLVLSVTIFDVGLYLLWLGLHTA